MADTRSVPDIELTLLLIYNLIELSQFLEHLPVCFVHQLNGHEIRTDQSNFKGNLKTTLDFPPTFYVTVFPKRIRSKIKKRYFLKDFSTFEIRAK